MLKHTDKMSKPKIMKNLVMLGAIFIIGWACSSWYDVQYINTNLKPLASVAFIVDAVIIALLGKKTIEMQVAKRSIITSLSVGIFTAMLTIMFFFGYYHAVGGNSPFSIKYLPSLGSAACFMVFCIYSFAYIYAHSRFKEYFLRGLTLLILIPSVMALIGRIVEVQWLHFYISENDTGMTLQASILFIILSLLMYLRNMELYADTTH